MIDQWFAKQGWAIAEELHHWIADRWLNIFFSLEMILDVIIWQNFQSEILASKHQTIWWNFQCEILAWNIVYLYSNDCLNHIWWKNLTMNFKIKFYLIILHEMSLDVIIWHNFHSEILASNCQTSFIIIQMIVFHEKWALMVIWALWHLEITFMPCIPVWRYQNTLCADLTNSGLWYTVLTTGHYGRWLGFNES